MPKIVAEVFAEVIETMWYEMYCLPYNRYPIDTRALPGYPKREGVVGETVGFPTLQVFCVRFDHFVVNDDSRLRRFGRSAFLCFFVDQHSDSAYIGVIQFIPNT